MPEKDVCSHVSRASLLYLMNIFLIKQKYQVITNENHNLESAFDLFSQQKCWMKIQFYGSAELTTFQKRILVINVKQNRQAKEREILSFLNLVGSVLYEQRDKDAIKFRSLNTPLFYTAPEWKEVRRLSFTLQDITHVMMK